MYKCECGKEFDNPQRFNGHKQGCEIHLVLKYGSLEEYYKIKNRSYNQGLETKHKKQIAKKQDELNQWISEQHTCEKCGKVMTEKFGSGRFCSRFCANSHIQSDETNLKRSKSLKTLEEKFCSNCGKKISKKSKTGYCSNCYRQFIPYSEEAKLKQSIKMCGKPRWHVLHGEPSYPEKYFKEVLENHKINFKREYQVKKADGLHSYYLDFLIDDKIDLEIDGSQHLERKEQDQIRDEYLTSLGYIVYRIPWNNINTNTGKDKIQEKLNCFFEFYNNFKLGL